MFPIFQIGPLSLPAPAFILLAGFFAGSYLLGRKTNSSLVDSEIIDRALWAGILSGLIGARLSYIAGNPTAFNGDLKSIFSINPSLLDPVGGFLILITFVVLIIIKNKIDPWHFLDSLTPFFGAMLPAFFLSLFASGNGFGTVTDLPWGIYLWGAIRHPVQLYLVLFSLIPLLFILVYTPAKNMPSGSSFLLFSAATFGYLLFCAAFQEPSLPTISGFRTDQILYWFGLLIMLVLINTRFHPRKLKVQNEIKK